MRMTKTLPVCICTFLWLTPAVAGWQYQVVDMDTNETEVFYKWPQNLAPNKHVIAIPDLKDKAGEESESLIISGKKWRTSNQERLAELLEDMRSKKGGYLRGESP